MVNEDCKNNIYEHSDELIKFIEDRLVERYKQHALISEVDFVVGVMSVLQFLTLGPDSDKVDTQIMPPRWFLYPMANRSLVAAVLKERGEDEKYVKSVENYELKRTYHMAKIDDMVRFVHMVAIASGVKAMKDNDLSPSETLEWFRGEARALLDDMMEPVEA